MAVKKTCTDMRTRVQVSSTQGKQLDVLRHLPPAWGEDVGGLSDLLARDPVSYSKVEND